MSGQNDRQELRWVEVTWAFASSLMIMMVRARKYQIMAYKDGNEKSWC